MANAFPEGTPTDTEFTEEVLAGVGEADSFLFTELLAIALESQQDEQTDDDLTEAQREQEAWAELVEIAEMPEREQRMHVLKKQLVAGIEFDTTMFGVPVLVTPIDDIPPPMPPFEPDSEPLQPIPTPPSLQPHVDASI